MVPVPEPVLIKNDQLITEVAISTEHVGRFHRQGLD